MRSLNKVFLLGRIGKAPEPLTTKKGQPYTRLHVATRRSWKDGEEVKDVTDWHYVMVWGPQAKICINGIKKGSVVMVEGHLSPYAVEMEEGKTEIRQSIHASRVSFFSTLPKEDKDEETEPLAS